MAPAAKPAAATADSLGRKLEACQLGNDCPFEPAVRLLEQERHVRIQEESALTIQIDEVLKQVKKVINAVDELGRRVGDVEHHIRKSRLVDLAIMGIGAGLGGLLAKFFTQ
jgi:hypothetical protein